MEVLQPHLDLDVFFQAAHAAPRRALLLDYEGTLAPVHIQRGQAAPYPGVRQVLNAILGAGHTRLVIISGGVASDLPPVLGLEQRPEIWGMHGWERLLPDGRYSIAPLDMRQAHGLAEARAWLEEQGLLHTCEDKLVSIAVYWRGLTMRAKDALRAEVLRHWSTLTRETGLITHEFDGGIELHASGHNKSFAVRTVLAELGAAAVTAYLGDDTTDEDAFRAIKPHGLAVLVQHECRPTAADLWLQPPEEVLTFLTRWIEADTAS